MLLLLHRTLLTYNSHPFHCHKEGCDHLTPRDMAVIGMVEETQEDHSR